MSDSPAAPRGLLSRAAGLFSLYRGLPRPIYAVFAATVVNGVGIFVFPFMTLFLTRRLGMSAGAAGTFMSLASLAYVPGIAIGGRLADRIGRKKVMIASQLLSGAMYVPCAFLGASPLVPAFVVLSIFFDGITDPARTAMLTDVTKPENRQASFSFIYLGHNLGFAFGPLVAGFLFEAAPAWIFLGNAIAIACAVALVARFVPETRPSAEEIEASLGSGSGEEAHTGTFLQALLSRPLLLVFTFLTTFYGFVYAQHRFALPLQAEASFGAAGAPLYGSLMTLNAVLVILLATPVVALTRRWAPVANVAASGFLFALGFAMVGLARNPALMYLSTGVWTLGEIVNATNQDAYVANHTPMSHRGRFQAVLPIIGGLGFSASSMVVGLLVEARGLAPVWPMLGIVAAAAALGVAGLGLAEARAKRRAGKAAEGVAAA